MNHTQIISGEDYEQKLVSTMSRITVRKEKHTLLEGLPTVFLFYRGQMIDKFFGYDLNAFHNILQKAVNLTYQFL
ncbi:hypothetical protein IMG5_118240 [Ichthyophthirius multifiliis]|uniref:Thioredoxin n=1 Tax=Ichthyophthirius multifiliis TaxID=5932 RepID=G0QUL5_ICHMU|nr:hypothetical protein IMG5_118240 [Ichthyophthirius multifiliis]EGR31099.1 hypothetical protein IMG5_118240 [Ichthyophthirius multifiliis]|eukprot:XP_004034585.1 hypothetical protein IMG5_118240 [Ichthyophthirius multifiliis]